MAAQVDLDAMYKSFGVLAETQDDDKNENEYLTFILGVKGDEKTKQLAAEFLQRYFDRFPAQQEHALDALMDLCEEPNTQIRSKAITSLFRIAKDNPDQIIRIADIITQFLQSEDEIERKNVEAYLLQLLNVDAKACIRGIFNHVGLSEEGVPPILQRRILQFLKNKSTELPASMSQDEVAQFVLHKTSSVVGDGSKEDSSLALEFLHSLRYFNTVAGTQQILDVLERLVDFDKPFKFDDALQADKLIRATEMSLTMFSRTTPSNKFVTYYSKNVVPLVNPNSDNPKHLELLRLFAQVTTNVSDLPDYEVVMMSVLDKTFEILPSNNNEIAPLTTIAGLVPAVVAAPNKAAKSDAAAPKLYLGFIECLLYALQQLGKRHEQFMKEAPNSITNTAAVDQKTVKLRRFKKQLQYYSQLKQAYERKFEASRKKKMQQPSTLTSDTKRQLEIVGRMISNVTQLIRDSFHTPPTYTSQIKLSWKSHAPTVGSSGDARKPITFGAGPDNDQKKSSVAPASNSTSASPTNKRKRIENGSSFNNTNASNGTAARKQPPPANNAKRAALWRK